MSNGSLVFAGIAPHPPIMVPEVGLEAIAEVRSSIDAMGEFTRRLIESGAETVIIISPHAPLETRAFVAYEDSQLYGDFAKFRCPELRVEASLDKEMLGTISNAASDQGYEVKGIRGYDLDHGTAVPLYFLQRNGWHGRVIALGYSFLSNDDHVRFGACLKHATDELGRPMAFVASGDLSHRLKPEAPAGFNPRACLFDQEVVDAIRDAAPERIVNIDQDLRRVAGECGYRSMLIAFGITGMAPRDCEVLSYEAPFGVGYLVAQIARNRPSERVEKRSPEELGLGPSEIEQGEGDKVLSLVRQAVETFVREGRVTEVPSDKDPMLQQPAACFVSIKTNAGELRGCIGTIEPVKNGLAEELIANAVSSAMRDPRFAPIASNELPQLRYSVDILSKPEPTTLEELDPKEFGVIVEDESGVRRGLLLPDLQGVETSSQQVDIAARKAGIAAGTSLRLFRFRVKRYQEQTGR